MCKINSHLFIGTIGSKNKGSVFLLKVDARSQSKHIPGSKEYIVGRSIITISISECQQLIEKYFGKGTRISDDKERIDFEKVIGFFVDYKTGDRFPTTIGIIHITKAGVHIVPAAPKNYRGGK